MKKFILLVILNICCIGFLKSQVSNSAFKKGTQWIGVGFSPTPKKSMHYTNDLLYRSKINNSFGLVVTGSYGIFLQKNWMVGGMLLFGGNKINSETYNQDPLYSFSGSTATQITVPQKTTIIGIGIAPFTRYYFSPFKNRGLLFFAHAALPIYYSQVKYQATGVFPSSGTFNYKDDYDITTVNTSFGGGISVPIKTARVEAFYSTTGLFVSYQMPFNSIFRGK